jgi:hypothetical protein
MIQSDFDIKQKISSFIAFTFVILLGLILSWYSIKTSEEILVNMPQSKTMNISKRIQNKNSQENAEIQNVLKENDIMSNEDAPGR